MPANLISNLAEADWNYFGKRVDAYIVNGFLEVLDRFPQLKPIEETFLPAENLLLKTVTRLMQPTVDKALYAAKHYDEVKCMDDPIARRMLFFIVEAEYPFFKDIVAKTYLNGRVRLPENSDDIAEQILQIPLCPGVVPPPGL